MAVSRFIRVTGLVVAWSHGECLLRQLYITSRLFSFLSFLSRDSSRRGEDYYYASQNATRHIAT